MIFQQELFADYIGMNFRDFELNNEELISRGVLNYIEELLEDQSVATWQKIPLPLLR